MLAAAMLVAGTAVDAPVLARRTVAPAAATIPLTIVTRHGQRQFKVELADTPERQERGLMFRTSVPKGSGMLFPMSPPRPASFWMKNTLVPLDMIFIRADGTIARIAAMTKPRTLDLVDSGEPVAAVLELAGGAAARQGIAEGDRVRWAASPRG